jgi:Peptidase family M20/M25/M40
LEASEIRSRAAGMMPELLTDLERLVGIPSVAFPGYPPEPVHQMADEALRLFRETGFANAELQEVPADYPPVYGEIPGPDGAPTVMLYAHYDVQPAPPEQGWSSDPWTATRKPDGRIYGRGAADDNKGGPTSRSRVRGFWVGLAQLVRSHPFTVRRLERLEGIGLFHAGVHDAKAQV